VGWEDALPGAGRPQDIINHLVDGCDIFVCIFHKRFGSPTGEEESGTLEEILRAYDCWKGKKKPQIMIYFKDVAIESLADLNDDQLKRLLEFKDEIEKNRMFLYDTFKEKDQFRVMLKKHMKAWIKKNLSSGKLPPGRPKRSPSPGEKILPGPFLLKYKKYALSEHRHLPMKGFETNLRAPIEIEQVYVTMRAHIHFYDFDLTIERKSAWND